MRETPLRRIRKQRGLTVEQLAVMAGHGSATVYRAERGQQKPTDDTLVALAAALDVPVDDLRHDPEGVTTPAAVGSPRTYEPLTTPAPRDAARRRALGARGQGD